MDIVIGFRQRYLEEYEKQEKNKLFLKYRKEVIYLLFEYTNNSDSTWNYFVINEPEPEKKFFVSITKKTKNSERFKFKSKLQF